MGERRAEWGEPTREEVLGANSRLYVYRFENVHTNEKFEMRYRRGVNVCHNAISFHFGDVEGQ